METIEKSIEIDRSIRSVYNQWTRFEDFPQFMEGVKSVRQIDDKRLHWEAEIAGKTKAWDAEIFEQEPDKRIAWRSMSGAMNSGMVNFEPLDPGRTRVTMRLNYKPEGVTEQVGDMLGIVSARVSGDLKRFKEFIENKDTPPEGWRGEIEGREVHPQGKETVYHSGV
jgi:uncharacterized membrane protein